MPSEQETYDRGYADGVEAGHQEAVSQADQEMFEVAQLQFDVAVHNLHDGDLLVVQCKQNPTRAFVEGVSRTLRNTVRSEVGKDVTVVVAPPGVDVKHIPGAVARQILVQLVADLNEPEHVREVSDSFEPTAECNGCRKETPVSKLICLDPDARACGEDVPHVCPSCHAGVV